MFDVVAVDVKSDDLADVAKYTAATLSSNANLHSAPDPCLKAAKLERLATSGPGSFAMLAAMRRASSRVSSLAAVAATRLLLEMDAAERLLARVANDEAGFLSGPARRETARGGHGPNCTLEPKLSF